MNYALSDIHGHLDEFNQMLDLINFDPLKDHLYILGDAMDKGNNSIELLLKIISMVKEGSVTYLLGNHDHMMFDYLRKEREGIPSTYQRGIWFLNTGDKTYCQYNSLTEEEKTEIYDFLKDLPVVIPSVKIADKEFYLVHSFPNFDIKETITMKDTGYNLIDVMPYVWNRVEEFDNDGSNRFVLAGHSICGGIEINNYINLDCGCAVDFRLGCLRLEDFEIFYVECPEPEEEQN